MAEERRRLDAIPVELQVRDTTHARSAEVQDFAVKHLSQGGTWEELRRKFGLGHSGVDRRWRVVRETVVDAFIPETEEEALRAQVSHRSYLLSKIETFIEEIEAKLMVDSSSLGSETMHHFMKMRLDGLKVLLEENNREFESFLNVRKLRAKEKQNRGVSIVVQNNFAIPRPAMPQIDASPINQAMKLAKAVSENE